MLAGQDGTAEQDDVMMMIDLADIPDQQLLEDGLHLLRVDKVTRKVPEAKVKDGITQPTYPFLNIQMTSVNDEVADPVYHRIFLATPSMDARTKLEKDRALKEFLRLCGKSLTGQLVFADLVGSELWAETKKREYQGRWSSEVTRLVDPPDTGDDEGDDD